MQLYELFVVFVALTVVTLSIRLIRWLGQRSAVLSVIYLSAHHIANRDFQMMIDGYMTLSCNAENAINASIVSPISEGLDEALGRLDYVMSCWDHLEEQLNIMIYLDVENRKSIRRREWQVITKRHERWVEVLHDIATTRTRHDALRLTHINHGQFQ